MSSSNSSNQPHPLRPYYQAPEESVFIATAPRFSTSGTPQAASRTTLSSSPSLSSPSTNSPLPTSTYNRYTTNDAKSYVATISSDSLDDRDAPFSDVIRALLVSGALQYTSTCLAMPFEVGKLLLQVQWVPRDDVWVQLTQLSQQQQLPPPSQGKKTTKPPTQQPSEQQKEDAWTQDAPEATEWQDDRDSNEEYSASGYLNDEEISDEEDADAYFRDVSSRPTQTDTNLDSTKRRKPRLVDSSGYVMRRSVYDEGTRPEFVMPVVVRGGVWEMIKAVGRGKEGWLGLWKGSLTSFIYDAVSNTLQPIVTSFLSILSPSALSPVPLAYAPYPHKSLALLLSSHLITGILLSPLDLVRTRLIAQSTLPAHRKYSGPYDALRKILDEEGGWNSVYLHPNLLIPTILDYTLRPLFSLGAPLLIEQTLRLEPNTHPISYAIAELAISTASLCITLPIETVRRRLQLQMRLSTRKSSKVKSLTSSSIRSHKDASRGSASLVSGNTSVKGLGTCVETRPVAYVGVVEAIYRILTEETSVTRQSKKSKGEHSPDPSTCDDSQAMAQSGILAKTGHSSLGGLRSLYRGFGMAFGANLVVFMLTLVSGERAGPTGWAEI